MRKQISPTCLALIIRKMNGPMNVSVASQKTRSKLHTKIFESIKESNQNREHLVHLVNREHLVHLVNQTQVIFPIAVVN